MRRALRRKKCQSGTNFRLRYYTHTALPVKHCERLNIVNVTEGEGGRAQKYTYCVTGKNGDFLIFLSVFFSPYFEPYSRSARESARESRSWDGTRGERGGSGTLEREKDASSRSMEHESGETSWSMRAEGESHEQKHAEKHEREPVENYCIYHKKGVE